MKFYFVTVPPENLRTWFTTRADADQFAKYFDGATVTKLVMPELKPKALLGFLNRYARGPAPAAGKLTSDRFFNADASREIDRLTVENEDLKRENSELRRYG